MEKIKPVSKGIGFDLIDLQDPLLKNRNDRTKRLIHHPDDKIIHKPDWPVSDFWLFWTAKEAIYKCLPIEDTFKPKTLSVAIQQKKARVIFESPSCCKGHFELTEGNLLAICHDDKIKTVGWYLKKMERPSDATFYQPILLQYFKSRYGLKLTVAYDDYKLPYLINENKGEQIRFSLSHHHQYFGFAYSFD